MIFVPFENIRKTEVSRCSQGLKNGILAHIEFKRNYKNKSNFHILKLCKPKDDLNWRLMKSVC